MARAAGRSLRNRRQQQGSLYIAVAATVFIGLLGGRVVFSQGVTSSGSSDTYSTRQLDPNYIEIRREKHRVRHWMWSGIFPYGGWIPDPHIIATPVFHLSDDVKAGLGGTPARYQGFDINPWFEDDSSEIVLAIDVGGIVFPYRLDIRALSGVKYGFVNGDKRLDAFMYEESLFFLTALDIIHPVFIEIGLPLSSGCSAVIHTRASPKWDQIGILLRQSCHEKQLSSELCHSFEVYDNRNSQLYVP